MTTIKALKSDNSKSDNVELSLPGAGLLPSNDGLPALEARLAGQVRGCPHIMSAAGGGGGGSAKSIIEGKRVLANVDEG